VKRAIVSWSGGKDAAWSLHRTRGEYEIVALVTTVSETSGAVPIHNIPLPLIAAQAEALALPLWTVGLPQPCPNAEYAARLRPIWDRAALEGIDTVIFGDLFLADIREWREQLLNTTGIRPVFPLWQEPTAELAREMIRGGLCASICAANDVAFVGRSFDEAFLAGLPHGTDPCGENGEFHTFVRNMPGFAHEVV
jgi:uncharacterized protein (TIGR00290 family)